MLHTCDNGDFCFACDTELLFDYELEYDLYGLDPDEEIDEPESDLYDQMSYLADHAE